MTKDIVFSNAKIILEEEIVEGSLVIRNGKIVEVLPGRSRIGEDVDGDFIIAGLIDLHTDHLETHYSPRPSVRWDPISAIQSHDAQVATSGITTVFDCLRLGSDETDGYKKGEMREIADRILQAQQEGRLRAEHRLHLRCEVSASDCLDHYSDFDTSELVGLVSLMDHAPGQRQFQTMDQYTLYYKERRGLTEEAFAAFVQQRKDSSAKHSARNSAAIAADCNARGIVIASHDDATLAHVEEARGYGVKLAEFPTTLVAADASHEAGMAVLMGAPNVVRGKSHSGNIAARTLAERGVLDVLSSDYIPSSLLHAPFVLSDNEGPMSLPEAIKLVTSTPARTAGLDDRGRIESGLRADVIRVFRPEGVPIVREVYREGRRVA